MKKLILFITVLTTIGCQSHIHKDEIIKCKDDVEIGTFIELDGDSFKVVDRTMLIEMINNNKDITHICTSKVTNMSQLFFNSKFNGKDRDISNWDVSNVTDMSKMFYNSEFNGDISNWDVSNVTNMSNMFSMGKWGLRRYGRLNGFNGDISNWDVSNVTNMSNMFSNSEFNGDISNWDVRNVTDMSYMFVFSPFYEDISNWDVSYVTNMSNMFNEELLLTRCQKCPKFK